jgi:long-chain acyl-CoA synthetase
MADFKPVVGYLALASRIGIVPIYLLGTYEAMPKGSNIIKSREIGARIGRYLSIEELEDLTRGRARAEAYRLIAALVKHEVENLRDRSKRTFDARGVRKQWKDERRAQVAEREDSSLELVSDE